MAWSALVVAAALGTACGWSSMPDDGGSIPALEAQDATQPAPQPTGTPAPPLQGDASVDDATSPSPEDAEAGVAEAAFVVAPHRAWPQVPDTDGATMTSPTLVTIVAANDVPVDGTDTGAMLQAFSDAFTGSDVWAAVSAEYGLGALTSASHLTGPAIAPGTYPAVYFQTYVGAVVYGDAGPAPNGNTIYLLYVPYGVHFNGDDPCGYHTGYPSQTTSTGDQLAVVRRCTPWYFETELGNLTQTASHEIAESATDPLERAYNLGAATATPWEAGIWPATAFGGRVELGDLCEGTRIFDVLDGGPEGGWELQRIWSNAAAADGGDPCVPPYAEPYYDVSAPEDWYAAAPGGAVNVPLLAWSAGPAAEWLLYPRALGSNDSTALSELADGGFALTSVAGAVTPSGCASSRPAASNDVGAVLHVQVPPGAVAGDYFVFSVESFRVTAPSCAIPLSEDGFHAWPVGVYVP